MSYDRPLPPPLPPQGFLLEQLGYLKEPLAAIALDIRLPTLIEYRKKKIGPKFAVIGRTIWYGPTHLQEWVEAGGTLAFTGDEPDVVERTKVGKPKPAPNPPKPAPKRTAREPVGAKSAIHEEAGAG